MTRKLEEQESIKIVRQALEDIRPNADVSLDEKLTDLMSGPAEQEQFRHTVAQLVKKRDFEIDSANLHLFPHTRIKDIADALSDLAGDPYTTKPHGTPPAPPTPKGDKPKYPGPGKKSEKSR